jgi:hypothetical protein
LTVVEYAPNTIKSSVVGYGLARKEQVQYMVARLLALPTPPEPADAADALAIAICHLHHAQTARNQGDGSANGDAGEGRAGWSARQRIEVRVAPAPLLQRLPSEQLGLPARKVCL